MSPGWTLGWTWAKKEVIWSMMGAQATDQGDCSQFKQNIPHSCNQNPAIVDLLPNVPKSQHITDCCKGGVLKSWGQDPSAAVSSFQLSVGLSGTSNRTVKLPRNFYLLGPGPGYTCGAATVAPPSFFFSSDGRRKTRAMMTWTVTCTYSQILASRDPKCCVSLSSFYNPMITPCPTCSCGCENTNCKMNESKLSRSVMQCTQHMCPIQVHWHVKTNYNQYWRVKISITNFMYQTNYTYWTLVVRHPNLNNVSRIYNFSYKPLHLDQPNNDTGVFYGINYHNHILMEAGKDGYVQSDLVLRKDLKSFSLEQGWAFPSKVYFNGDECVMPAPDSYPFLPNSVSRITTTSTFIAFLISVVIAFWGKCI